MKKLLFLLLLIPFLGNSQATFTAPVGYNTGAPTATPSGVGTRWRFDLLTGKKYTWLPGSMSWDEDARGIDQVAGCSAPLYTPGYNQSTFAVNACTVPELYQWTGAAWVRLNEGEVYTAGTGISIDGSNVISSTVTSDALGTGFTSGGGSGTIPEGTVAQMNTNSLQFLETADEYFDVIAQAQDANNFSGTGYFGGGEGEYSSIAFFKSAGKTCAYRVTRAGVAIDLLEGDEQVSYVYGIGGLLIYASSGTPIKFTDDYSAIIVTDDRNVPDVGTVNLLKQNPVSYTNAAAPNNCIFYSTTLSKLAYKDPGGTVNPLY